MTNGGGPNHDEKKVEHKKPQAASGKKSGQVKRPPSSK